MIKTVIFDVGNVLTYFGWKEFIKAKGYPEDICKRIGDATIENVDWREYDRGVLTEEEILNRFIANDPELETQIREVIENLDGILIRADYAIPWIEEVKAMGCQVLFLSNFSAKAYRECNDVLDFEPYMDGGIWSYRVQMIKPDRCIYRELLDQYNLVPEECVFIDDTEANIVAANNLKINTIHFVNYDQASQELRELIK